jgi:hypothetical protein
MSTCPVCQTKIDEKAKFCSECGVQLTDAPSERAWVVSMQEQIKAVRHNDVTYNIIAVLGVLIAVAVPFLMRYILHYDMDLLSWILTVVGVVFFIVSTAALWWDDNKIKKLIKEMKAGQPLEEYVEPGEEGEDTKTDAEEKE